MYTRHLSVADFRSWTSAELPLSPGVNVLLGRNGVGKTNLVEALGYLATLSSHRVSGDIPLIRRGAERAIVRAAVVHDGRELMLEVEITAGKANRARLNRSPVTRARDILGILRTVLFAPEDLALVRGDPSERRRFLDEVLIMRAPRFAGIKSDYDRALKQRNSLLKSAGAALRRSSLGTGGGDLSTLEVWDEQLAGYGATLLSARLRLVEEIRPHVVAAYADLAPNSEPADLAYKSSLGEALPEAGAASPESDLAAAFMEEMQRLRRAELERGISLVGTHRDDLDLILGAGLAKGYASHGESWSFALALKLGGFGLLRSDGVDPVLILDDVFAELDSSRRSRLASLVADADQVLITAAVGADVPMELLGAHFLIEDGTVTAIPVSVHPAAAVSVAVDPVAADPDTTDPITADGSPEDAQSPAVEEKSS